MGSVDGIKAKPKIFVALFGVKVEMYVYIE